MLYNNKKKSIKERKSMYDLKSKKKNNKYFYFTLIINIIYIIFYYQKWNSLLRFY